MPVTEGAPRHGSVAHLLPQTYKRLISEWLEEDTPSFDYGGFVVGEEVAEARLLGKSKVRTSFFFSAPASFVFRGRSSMVGVASDATHSFHDAIMFLACAVSGGKAMNRSKHECLLACVNSSILELISPCQCMHLSG